MSYDYIVKIGADVSGIATEIESQLKKSNNAKIKIQCDDSAVQKVISELSHLDKKTANRIKIDIDNTGVYKSLTQIREFAHNEVTRIQNEISSINFGELQSKLAESEKQLADAVKKAEHEKARYSKDILSTNINDLYKHMEKTPSSSGQYAKMSQDLLNLVEAFKQSGGKIADLSTQIQSSIQALYSQGMSGKFTPPDFSAYDLEVDKWKQRVTDLKAQVDHYHNLQDQLSGYTYSGVASSNAANVDTSKSQAEVDALKNKTKDLGTELQNVSKAQIAPENITTLLTTLDNILKSIQQISLAFGTIDDSGGISNLLSSIQELKQGLSNAVQEIQNLSTAVSGINLNVNISSGGKSASQQASELADAGRATAKILKEAFLELQNITGMSLNNNSSFKYLVGDARDLYTELERLNTLESTALTGKFEGKSNVKQQNLALKELIDLYQKAATAANIDISGWVNKYSNSINQSVTSTQNMLSGTKQAEDAAKQLSSLFGNVGNITLDNLTVEMDKVVAKLQEIITLLSSGVTTDISAALGGQNGIQTEVTSLDSLKQKILEIKNAIVAKNTAFSQEASIVASSVSSEVNQLQLLHTNLRVILQTLEKIQGTPVKLNISGLEGSTNSQEFVNKSITDLKTSLSGLDPTILENISTLLQSLSIDSSVAENMQKLANAILNLKGNLNNVSMSGMEFLNSIKAIVAEGAALNNLVQVLNTTKEKLDAAKQAAADVSNSGAKKGTKDTGVTQKTQEVIDLERAYQHLMNTEKEYQQLRAKVDTGVATKEQEKAFEVLTSLREQDNAKIKEAIGLLGEQSKVANDLKQNYDAKVNTNTSKYYDPYVDKINASKLLYEADLNRTKQLMDQVMNPNIAGFESVWDRAKAKIDELNQKLLEGKIGNIQTGYTDQVNKIVADLRNTVAVASPFDPADAKKKIAEYAQTLGVGSVKIGEFDKNAKNLNVTFKDHDGLIKQVTLSYDHMTGSIAAGTPVVKTAQSIWAGFADGLKARFKSLIQYLTIFVSYYRIIGMFKKGIGYVRELDTALTEMRKVSDETVATLRKFQDASFDIANSVGTTGKQIQNSTADFMRLGKLRFV